ncbi:hypothetical protein AB1Y20_009807 [Prymnesium parvum]|uniref:Uncharacterized protein n=1 Tax=Prymnesium parvum TaxID=97485 RepID=A0AB34K5G9_PRYPA
MAMAVTELVCESRTLRPHTSPASHASRYALGAPAARMRFAEDEPLSVRCCEGGRAGRPATASARLAAAHAHSSSEGMLSLSDIVRRVQAQREGALLSKMS